MPEFYNLSPEQAFKELNSSEKGLTEIEAKKRTEKFGYNKLEEKKEFSALKAFIGQFKEFLVVILIVAALISWFFGDQLDAIAIIAIVILNGILGFLQEFKANKAMQALKKMASLKTKVLRDNEIKEIDSAFVVPGDIVILDEGAKVPADVRIIEQFNLKIDQAILTGESNPVNKIAEAIDGKKAVGNISNIAFSNTVVTYGRGKGIVVGTGMKTEFGKIANMIQTIEETETPLHAKLEELGKKLVYAILAIIVVMFLYGFFAEHIEFLDILLLSISLAVAAIPEGLPAVITITLALGIQEMAKRNAIVRRMPAVEALGSATVICSDKTGTLTRNEMFVEKIFANNQLIDITGTGYEPVGEFLVQGKRLEVGKSRELLMLLEIGLRCNDASLTHDNAIVGDPTEGALVVVGKKAFLSFDEKRIDEIPFDSGRKMMSAVYKINGKNLVFVKGAPETILNNSSEIFENGKTSVLTSDKRKQILAQSQQLSSKAYRMLGFAFKQVNSLNRNEYENKLVFVGLTAMRDPPRENVKEAISLCAQAGIKVKMITGDNALTAEAIAEKLGFENIKAITGEELDELSAEKFSQVVSSFNVFARVAPEHKLKIVQALKQKGEIVAVTGDGVNDAPALKNADIGMAMGIKGTDVAKEASDIILKDDNFSTIVNAIEQGRKIRAGISNFVKYLLAANFAEVVIITILTFVGFPSSMLPLQLLWLNIVTDALPALALGTEQIDHDVMSKPPRNPKKSILDEMKAFIVVSTIILSIAGFIAFFYGLQIDQMNGVDLFNLSQPSKARTMAFTTVVIFELFLVFSCRRENKTALELNPFGNKWVVLAVISSLALQLLVLEIPFFQLVFKTTSLSIIDWLVIILLSLSSVLVPYFERAYHKFFPKKE